MKNLFNINEDERQRIINLQEKATKNHYLVEQPTQNFGQDTQQTIGPKTLDDSGLIIKKGLSGDPYIYGKLGDDFYYAKASDGENPNWILATNQNSINSIKSKIYNEKIPVVKTVKTPNKTTAKKQPVKKQITTNSKNNELRMAKKIVGTTDVTNPNAYLLFNGEELQWIVNGSVIKTWKAVSGLTLFNTPISNWGQLFKRFTSSPEEFSKDKDAGPTPPGNYTVGPIQTRKNDNQTISSIKALWGKLTGSFDDVSEKDKAFQANSDYSRIGWGNYRATITPNTGTKVYGRTDFYIHGGTLPGSHGCIDLTNQMDDFAKFYGTWLSTTKKNSIQLVVNYKTPSQNTFISKLWSTNSDGSKRLDDYRMKNKFYTDPGKI